MNSAEVRAAIDEYEVDLEDKQFDEDEEAVDHDKLRIRKSVEHLLKQTRKIDSALHLISTLSNHIYEEIGNYTHEDQRRYGSYKVFVQLYHHLSDMVDHIKEEDIEPIENLHNALERNAGRRFSQIDNALDEIREKLRGFQTTKEGYSIRGSISIRLTSVSYSKNSDDAMSQLLKALPSNDEIANLFASKGIMACLIPVLKQDFNRMALPSVEVERLMEQGDYDKRHSYGLEIEDEDEEMEEEPF